VDFGRYGLLARARLLDMIDLLVVQRDITGVAEIMPFSTRHIWQ
jgi:hypothetical protein